MFDIVSVLGISAREVVKNSYNGEISEDGWVNIVLKSKAQFSKEQSRCELDIFTPDVDKFLKELSQHIHAAIVLRNEQRKKAKTIA